MSDFAGRTAVVVGAGAFGSVVAVELARRGADVTVIDARPLAQNASGIAAGMLAPAFEAVLDPVSAGCFDLFVRARDLWLSLDDSLEATGLDRCGALLRAPAADLDRIEASLNLEGARCERVGDAIYTPEDWRLEPRLALAALRRELVRNGGRTRQGEAGQAQAGSVTLKDGSAITADIVVLACGYDGLALAPELSVLTPIKGQLLRFPDVALADGPILRSLLGYVVPSREGAVAGASMEEGLCDLSLSPDVTDRLRVEAAWLAPGLGLAHANGFAGVRAASPDGLPLIGRSTSGVWLAAGARRNGWLLAPLAAAVLCRAIAQRPAVGDALFSPGRFSPG